MTDKSRRTWKIEDQARPPRSYRPYACFKCRKCFHRSVEFPNASATLVCPECGAETVQMNQRFKAPRKDNVAQWKKVEALVLAGFHFQPVGEPYPKVPRELREFLKTNRKLR